MNKVILIGRLTRDPELRYTPSGTPVAKFTLAVDRSVKKDQEKTADFIDIITWEKKADDDVNGRGFTYNYAGNQDGEINFDDSDIPF